MIDSVNAFTQLVNAPIEAQDGLLKGYRFAVKDVFDLKGFRTQAGNPDYFAQTQVAETTAPAITILQDVGAQLVGKTHTDELGGSLFGLNKHYGPPLNSRSPAYVPGGSSSGSAAAVAANLVDFALGADTSGSVRAPASFCGIYGLRPTFGRIPTAGVLPISAHLDTVGIFAQHPDLIGQVLKVYDIKEETEFIRFRVVPSLIEQLESSLKEAFFKKLNVINNLMPGGPPLFIDAETLIQWSTTIRTIAMYDLWQVHKDWILKSNPTFGELINDRIKMARAISYDDYKQACLHQKIIRDFMENSVAPGDVIIFPTVHDIPPLLSTPLPQLKDFALKTSRHTCIAALAGFPEITVPLRDIKNECSLGMSFLGRAGEDYSLTALAGKVHPILRHCEE
jgi:amidase